MSFFSRDKGELSAVFDIGPQNVGVALVPKKASDIPQIIWTHRESFVDEKTRSPRELLEALLSALKKTNDILHKDAISELHIKGFGALSSIHYVLSSPWVEIEQKTLTLTFKEPTTITQKIVNDALNSEEVAFETSFKQSAGFAIVEKTITGFALNGYGVKDPYNKKATALQISFTIAITPKEVLDRIEESVSSKKAHTSAFITAAYSGLKELYKEKDFLCVIIEDNLTEVVVVRDGTPFLDTSFPVGGNTLAQSVAKDIGVSFVEAQTLARMYDKKEADQATADKIATIVKKERDLWRKALKASIESIVQNTILPRKVFFISSDIGAVFVAHMTKSQKISEFGIDDVFLETVIVSSASFKGKIVFSNTSHTDVRLGLITVATSQAGS